MTRTMQTPVLSKRTGVLIFKLAMVSEITYGDWRSTSGK
jgi:hypothetical protein